MILLKNYPINQYDVLDDSYLVTLRPISLEQPLQIFVFANSNYEAQEKAWKLINYANIDTSYGINAVRIS